MTLLERFRRVRATTLELAGGLTAEDAQMQSMPDASPAKWHLAHTTWFFETFVAAKDRAYRPYDPSFAVLFNSYYESVGRQHIRAERGLLSRPSLEAVVDYRAQVEAEIVQRLEAGALDEGAQALLELGLHHEQQHQELLLTDIKHAFSRNPGLPAVFEAPASASARAAGLRYLEGPTGVVEIGARGQGFAFDNEGPRHRVHLEPYALASRAVTNGEFLEFVKAGGYREVGLWLSAAWARVREAGWTLPLYWREEDGAYFEFTLFGERPLELDAPVTHLSLFEADAYARWVGARLPTEFEWEAMATTREAAGLEAGHLLEDRKWHPRAGSPAVEGLLGLFGDSWEWTSSSYAPYPGFRPAAGAVGEYNGKFMVDQYVLRGGSIASARAHVRASYRNFFPSASRWQFSGLRLARSA